MSAMIPRRTYISSPARCPVSDTDLTDSPADDEMLDEPVAAPSRTATRRPRKKAAPARTAAPERKAAKRAPRKAAKASKVAKSSKSAKVAPAAATAREDVKVGSHTVGLPSALAANLTAKDVKKLRAILKRVNKRGKKRAGKKAGAKSN